MAATCVAVGVGAGSLVVGLVVGVGDGVGDALLAMVGAAMELEGSSDVLLALGVGVSETSGVRTAEGGAATGAAEQPPKSATPTMPAAN